MKNVVYKRKKTHDGGDVKEPKGISAKAVLYGNIYLCFIISIDD